MEALTIFLAPIILLCAFAFDVCFGDPPKLHDLPVSNQVTIHESPKVGDFAIYAIDKYTEFGAKVRFEVVEVSDNHITVRDLYTSLNPDYKEYNKKDWMYKLIDRNGKVLKAWVVYESGEKYHSPIAKPGEFGSIQDYTKVNMKDRVKMKPVVTKAGRIKVDAVYTFYQNYGPVGSIDPSVHLSSVDYQSDAVPFKRMRLETYIVPDKEAFIYTFLEASEYLEAAVKSYINQNPMALYNVATKERNYNMNSKLELIKFGFGK